MGLMFFSKVIVGLLPGQVEPSMMSEGLLRRQGLSLSKAFPLFYYCMGFRL